MAFPVGAHRFLYGNLLTAANAVPSEVALGRITQATKDIAVGGAIGRPSGSYTGLVDRQFVVEIDSVGPGTSIGQATYRYSTDGGSTWVATGQTTAASVSLAYGISFAWSAGAGSDFALGDRWIFKALVMHAVEAALDYQDRNRSFRTRNVTGMKTIDIDLGAAATAKAAFLLDHNLTSAVTAKVRGNTSASWSSPPVDETLAYTASKIGKFFTGGSYRYWRVELTDAANGAGYLDLSTLYLGDYLELSTRKLSHIPWNQERLARGIVAESERGGFRRESVESVSEHFPLTYGLISASEYDALVAMRDACWDTTNKLKRPLIFVPDHTVPSAAYLCYLDKFNLTGKRPTTYAGTLELTEVVRL